MLLPFSIRVADHLFRKELFIGLTVLVFRGRLSSCVFVLLSLIVLNVIVLIPDYCLYLL